MGTVDPYDRRVPKARFSPDEATEREIQELLALHGRLAEVEAAYRSKLAELARPNGPVPIAHLAERLNVERKTVYRHLGRSMT